MINAVSYKADICNGYFKGDTSLKITYENGNYIFEIVGDSLDFDTNIEIKEISESECTLTARLEMGFMPGKIADIRLTFTDDTCNGYLKIPFIGKIKIANAVKI